MSTETNKTMARRWYEDIFNQGQLQVADEICSPDYVNIDPYGPPGGWPRGPEGTKALVITYRTAFPDLHFAIEDQIAEGTQVVTRWTARGTHTGPMPGGIAPTGRAAVITGISIERCFDGQLVATRVNWDMLGMLQQLGIIPFGS